MLPPPPLPCSTLWIETCIELYTEDWISKAWTRIPSRAQRDMNHQFYVAMRLADFLVMNKYLQNTKVGNGTFLRAWRGRSSTEDSCILQQIVQKLLWCHGHLGQCSRGEWQCLSNILRVGLHPAKQGLLISTEAHPYPSGPAHWAPPGHHLPSCCLEFPLGVKPWSFFHSDPLPLLLDSFLLPCLPISCLSSIFRSWLHSWAQLEVCTHPSFPSFLFPPFPRWFSSHLSPPPPLSSSSIHSWSFRISFFIIYRFTLFAHYFLNAMYCTSFIVPTGLRMKLTPLVPVGSRVECQKWDVVLQIAPPSDTDTLWLVGVGCLSPTFTKWKVKLLVPQSFPTLCDPMDCSLPVSSIHGISQTKILEWVAIPFSRRIFLIQGLKPGLLHCRQILYCLSHPGSPYFYKPLLYPWGCIQLTQVN